MSLLKNCERPPGGFDSPPAAVSPALLNNHQTPLTYSSPKLVQSLGSTSLILVVNEPDHCDVDDSDVVRALETVQIQAVKKLDPYLDNLNHEKSRVLAFYAHNLANAKTFEMRLRSRMESR